MAVGDVYPIRAAIYRIPFVIFDNTGAIVTTLTGLSTANTLISKDGGTAAASTNAPVEIATNSGLGYLDLTATEMTADLIEIKITATNANSKATPIAFYTKRLSLVRGGTAQAGAAGSITLDSGASASDDFYNGCYVRITTNTGVGQVRKIYDYSGSNKIATIMPNWGTNPDNTSVFEVGSELGVFPVGNIASVQNVVDGVYDEARADHSVSGSFGEGMRIAEGELNFKKNTAFADFEFHMVLTSDHLTEATLKTVTVQRSIDGGAFANADNTPADEVGHGTYKIDLTADDLNGNCVTLRFTASACDARKLTIITQP